jgi:hypothetical protein
MLPKTALWIFVISLFANGIYAGDKNGKHMVHVLHAYEQSTNSGTPGAIQKGYQFLVVWKGSETPLYFMWRGERDLVACKVQRAHKNTISKPGEPAPEYMTSFIAAGSRIVKYDTLLITPLAGRGGFHGVLPGAKTRKALYFSTGEKKWFFAPIKNIEKKQPQMMP